MQKRKRVIYNDTVRCLLIWCGRMMKMKSIGIGYENNKRIIDDGCYYADKTLSIKGVMKKGGIVKRFTCPRQFGKTLALFILRTFYVFE